MYLFLFSRCKSKIFAALVRVNYPSALRDDSSVSAGYLIFVKCLENVVMQNKLNV